MYPHIMWRDREHMIRTLAQFGNGLVLIHHVILRKFL